MKLQTKTEQERLLKTANNDKRKWAECLGWEIGDDSHFKDGTKSIVTFQHGKRVWVCKHCINRTTDNVSVVGKETAKKVLIDVVVTTTSDETKAYLFANGYAHISPLKWELKALSFQSQRKIIDELTKTEKFANATIWASVKQAGTTKEFKGVKDAQTIKDYIDSLPNLK
jgi:hypothetical protein